MAETSLNTYSVTTANAANTSSNAVAVVNDGTANRQIVTLGAGDGTATLVDGTAANPLTNKISDGTNVASVVAGDTGNNSQIVSAARKEVTFTTTTVQAVATTDVSNYRWVSIQIATQGTSSTVTFQTSNDNANWFSQTVIASSQTQATGVSTTTTTGVWHGPLYGRYFRLNVTGITAGTTSGTVEFFSMPSIMQTMGVNAAQGGTWTVQPGNTANTTPWLTSQTPATSGGLTISRTLSAASTNATSVKASAGQAYAWSIFNTSASTKFVKLYNKASAPTVGTDTPVMTIPVPAGGGSNISVDSGITFATGIALAITGAYTDADTTATAAGDVICNLLYK